MIRTRLLVAGMSLLALGVSAETPSKEAFTDEMNKARAATEQYKTASLYWLLERDDLSDSQRRYVKRIYADLRASSGDDLTGSVEANFAYLEEHPEHVDDNFYRNHDFRFGQYNATAKRVYEARTITDQYITDLWALGHWLEALATLQMSVVVPNTVLMQDMHRTGYLCTGEEGITDNRYRYTLNGKEYDLGFCPTTHTPIFPAPQPWIGENVQEEIMSKNRLLNEMQAELQLRRYTSSNN